MAAAEAMRAKIKVQEAKPTTIKVKAVRTRVIKPKNKTKKCPSDHLKYDSCISLEIFGI